MPITINTNVASMQAQNSLTKANQALQQNQQRLSTGLRINSAADDAAGMSISTRMSAQIRGQDQAVANSNDGISMLQTAEGGMQEVSNILQRMRELAVQSSNETNTDTDRESLNQEYQEKLSELDRIAEGTDFNGKKLLNGTLGEAQFQVGAGTGSTDQISIDLSTSIKSNNIGETKEFGGDMKINDGVSATGPALASGELQMKHQDTDVWQKLDVDSFAETNNDGSAAYGSGDNATLTGKTSTSAYAIAQAINDNSQLSVNAQAENTYTGVNPSLKATATTTGSGNTSVSGTYTLKINGESIFDGLQKSNSTNITTGTGTAAITIGAEEIAGAINAQKDKIGVTAQVTEDAGKVKLNNLEGGDIMIEEKVQGDFNGTSADVNSATGTGAGVMMEAGTVSGPGADPNAFNVDGETNSSMTGGGIGIFRGDVQLQSDERLEISDEDTDTSGGAAEIEKIVSGDVSQDIGAGGSATLSALNESGFLETTDITTVNNAQKAIDRIDEAITDVNTFRSDLGATQNRLDSSINNLNNSIENTSAARGQIRDADIAKESAEMTQNNIRRQASSSILAQANQNPQVALQLLGG